MNIVYTFLGIAVGFVASHLISAYILRKTKHISYRIASERLSSSRAEDIAKFFRKNTTSKVAKLDEQAMQRMSRFYGQWVRNIKPKDVYDGFTDRCQCISNMIGCNWWLANFCRCIDMAGLRMSIDRK